MLVGHALMLRGDDRRKLELADLSLDEMPKSEGPSACFAVQYMITGGKTNKTGKKDFMAAIRHKDPTLCSMGALAQLLFWRWHLAGEAIPDFSSRTSWYNTKLLVGKDKKVKISYPTQYADTWRVFEEAGILSYTITHAARGSAAMSADKAGVNESQAGDTDTDALLYSTLTAQLDRSRGVLESDCPTAGLPDRPSDGIATPPLWLSPGTGVLPPPPRSPRPAISAAEVRMAMA